MSITIPGIEKIDSEKLKSFEQISLESELEKLSELKVYFENNRSTLVKGQDEKLSEENPDFKERWTTNA